MIKVIFDTVVFVRSLINPHSRSGKILFSNSHLYQLYVSEPIIIEILEVLTRPELTIKFHSLKTMSLPSIIELLGYAPIVEIINAVPKVSRDPHDDKFLATAHAAKADYLVTEDQDLLVLKKYHRVTIITTERFLTILTTQRKIKS